MGKRLIQDSWVRGTAIGKGSYGAVSLAVRNKDKAVFAVKSVDTGSCLTYRIEALESEIRILRSVSSPFVVGYLGDDVTVENSGVFRNLHMEYLPGGTVAEVARARQPGVFGVEDERVVRDHAFCVVSGLKHLHSQGIVHCDIKGDNVLVGATPGTAKLADFGSAAAMTETFRPRGSPLWMAPEVIRGEYQGPESDVWSLGCMVIEMVTGKPAWEDRGAANTICRIGYSGELPQFPAQLSETGRDFLDKCLRREINQRWSCDQLLQHPFISKCSPPEFATYSSPRCVLDWFNLDSDEEENSTSSSSTSTIMISDSEIKDRIGKLASGGGRVIWESDGWELVRGLVTVTERESAALSFSDSGCCGHDEDDDEQREEGTRAGYWELDWVEGEIGEANLSDDDSIGIGEWSGRSTSEECLVDSFYCSVAVEEVRNEHHHREGGGVTDSVDDCRTKNSLLLLLLYWVIILHRFYYTICTQLLIPMASMKLFGYVVHSFRSLHRQKQRGFSVGKKIKKSMLYFKIYIKYKINFKIILN